MEAQSIKLNGPLAQPLAGDVTDYQISPAGTHVVYRADQSHDEVFELFAAPLDGSETPVRLHAPLPAASQQATACYDFLDLRPFDPFKPAAPPTGPSVLVR